MDYKNHYARLFEPLEKNFGKLDDNTITSIIGFSAGGPINMCEIAAHKIFITAELSVHENHKSSTDRLKFELFSKGDFNETRARQIFTALGNLSMEHSLGHEHTVDVSYATGRKRDIVVLVLFAKVQIKRKLYGIYQVSPVRKPWYSKFFDV